MERREEYNRILESYQAESKALHKKYQSYLYLRLISFLLLSAVVILSVQFHVLAGIIAIYVSISLFYQLVKAHLKITKRKKIVNQIILLNKNELLGLDYDYSAWHSGDIYKDRDHPYIDDLDIFGQKSLFQYSCRSNTYFGLSQLAQIYKRGIDPDIIVSQHVALSELENKIRFRQELYAFTALNEKVMSFDLKFIDWLDEPSTINYKNFFYFAIPIMTSILVILCYLFLPNMSMLLAFIPGGLFSLKYGKAIGQFQSNATQHTQSLVSLADSIALIEAESFTSTLLLHQQRMCVTGISSASDKIRRLAFCLNQLGLRNSFFGIMINLVFPWDYYWSHTIHKWKQDNRVAARAWFNTIGWFESRSSLATLGYNNPAWTYPTIHNDQHIKAIDIGHPLIPQQSRITNDFASPTQTHIKIVTGSNMGGKSTFLRSIGINIVLANAGAKVAAAQLELPYLNLFTSMRTMDALDENTSSFYAELKRIRLVLDEVRKQNTVYFLMDEILKGTNSTDRHTGAKALIKQLIKHHGAGLISTHDLALGELARKHPDTIENICFEVEVSDDQLIFDYKLRPGVSKSFNATQLMKNMGIDI